MRFWIALIVLIVSLRNSPMIANAQSEHNKSVIQIADGKLIIVGGGLKASNKAVFERLIEFAGGVDRAHVVILPTASISLGDSQIFEKAIQSFGIPPDRVEILDVTYKNAAESVRDPAILGKVRHATAVFLAGGDQRRLVRLLTETDGSDTPLLSEIRSVLKRGGVVAGTSAGASAQSATMLAVAGLPDPLIDEGIDTLDFGITTDANRRGLLISRGFGFFKSGIIDQHFNQYRGRLGRLIRAVDHTRVPYGFGIDENTAIVVQPDRPIEVLGTGLVTVIKPSQPGKDDPRGYQIRGVSLTLLSTGDAFDPHTGAVHVASQKVPILHEKAEYDGNFLIHDIAAGGAAPFAMINGLAENKKRFQQAMALKLLNEHSHGYRFLFRKTDATQAHAAFQNYDWVYSLQGVVLDITPIWKDYRDAFQSAPSDVTDLSYASELIAISFRGIMPGLPKFRPDEAITRGEFASAIARSMHLMAAPESLFTRYRDVDPLSHSGDEILKVIHAGFMACEEDEFYPDKPLDQASALQGLRRLAELYPSPDCERIKSNIQNLEQAGGVVRREHVARILHALLGLPGSYASSSE